MPSDDPEIVFLQNFWGFYDKLTVRLSVIIVGALLLVGVTLFVSGLFFLVESWEVILGSVGLSVNYFPLEWEGNVTTIIIEALGRMMIGYAVLDLARSILREEIAEETTSDVQERARGFVSRILSVIVIALSVEVFANEAKYSAVSPELLWQIAVMTAGIAALLVGWGAYLRLSKIE